MRILAQDADGHDAHGGHLLRLFEVVLIGSIDLAPCLADHGEAIKEDIDHDPSDDGAHEPFSRKLLEDKPRITEEMVRGYMSNTELETAVHAFGSRCSNISRVYSIKFTHWGTLLVILVVGD